MAEVILWQHVRPARSAIEGERRPQHIAHNFLAVNIASMLRRIIFVVFLCMVSLASSMASEQPPRPPGPAMMVHFDYYPKDPPQIRVLEHRLKIVLEHAGAGELGETEFHVDGNDGYLYMYGPDSDRLYAVTRSILTSSRLMSDAEVTKWHGLHTESFRLK